MQAQKVKIGYVPTKRGCFNHPEYETYRDEILEKIKVLGAEIVEIVELPALKSGAGIAQFVEDIEPCVKAFNDAEVDGLFFPHCNFGEESVVARIAAGVKKPVLLWGPRDGMPAPNEGRTRDTQCGLFATGKVLRRHNVPFTYLVNTDMNDIAFENGFRSFAAVCSVVRDFRKIRVLQISVRPDAFWTVMYNEGELLEKYGIEVQPITFPEVKACMDQLEADKCPCVAETVADFKARMNTSSTTDAQLTRMSLLLNAIRKLAAQYNCNGVAINCWGPVQMATGACTCTINGCLTELGLPVACEVDIHGAVTSIILQAAAMRAKTIFFADLTIRHPENDNAELLWHCGNFPPSLAINSAERPLSIGDVNDAAGRSNWEIKHGDVTVCRFDGDHGNYQLMIGEGKGVDGPQTTGTYMWFEVDNWPKWEKHLVEGPYIHHCSGVHGHYAHVLYEACKYLGIKADPISPTAEELEERWLTGKGWED